MPEKLPPIGKTFSDEEWTGRDAVHVAIVPVVASQRLYPGTRVDKHGRHGSAGSEVGIVDPYLTTPVNPGDQFFIFLYPRSVTGLRHVWTHPDFEDEQ